MSIHVDLLQINSLDIIREKCLQRWTLHQLLGILACQSACQSGDGVVIGAVRECPLSLHLPHLHWPSERSNRGTLSSYSSDSWLSVWSCIVRPAPHFCSDTPCIEHFRLECLQGDEAINFEVQEVKVQGHTMQKLDLMAWGRHHSWPI